VDYRLSIDPGQGFDAAAGRRRMRAGEAYLPYTLAAEAFSGIGTGFRIPIELPLAATLRGDDYRDLPADTYTDTIRVLLEP
jgi:spore coat protein U-like protein